jgi:nucleoid-associated protein YgaU
MRELAVAGWEEIPNSGKVPVVPGEKLDLDAGVRDGLQTEAAPLPKRAAHVEKGAPYEVETMRYRGEAEGYRRGIATDTQIGARTTASAPEAQTVSKADFPRVDTVFHVVESKENFWTISGLYYGSPRYYRALWKANAKEHPQIDGIHVDDVIKIPPPEDLDPSYIDPPRQRSSAARSSQKPPPEAGRRASLAAESETHSGEAESSSSSRAELNLPSAKLSTVSRRDRDSDHVGRVDSPTGGDEEDDDRAPSRSSTSRTSRVNSGYDRTAVTQPVYKIRPRDTLRSIARDTLRDPRRADEIAELNRDVIKDPLNLVVGQIIELPEDARTPIRRSDSRTD